MVHLYVSLMNRLSEIRDEERGATAVEYGLMVTLIAVVIITVVASIGTNLTNKFQAVSDALEGILPG